MQVTRQYHSTALLLPDGRVLSAGGGICGACDESGLPGQERRGLLAALPLPQRRVRRARPAAGDHLGARQRHLQRAIHDRHPQPGLDQQGRAGPAGRGHALGEHGAALHPASVLRRRGKHHGHRTAERQHRAARLLHAVRDQLRRRALGGEHGAGRLDHARLLRRRRASLTPTPTPPPTTTTPRSRARPRPARPSASTRPPAAPARPLGTGTAATFGGAGITTAVTGDQTTNLRGTATNAAGNASPCSSAFAYTEDSIAPAAPSLTDTDPDSPANDNNPEVKGSAEANTTIRIYSTAGCTGSPLATGTAATFGGAGITTPVPGDVTTQLRATAADAAGNVSPCSSALPYTEDSSGPTPPPGLVAAFGFNEGVGFSAADASPEGNTGTVSGAAWAPAGRFGGALSFDGVNDWVTVADDASLDLSGALTMEAWVRPSSPPSGWRTVLLKERSFGHAYALYSGGQGPLVEVASNGYQNAGRTGQLPAATWTHLAATLSGGSLRLYVDGNLVDSITGVGSLPNGDGPLRIGGNSIWGNEFFAGQIDEVRIYNRALSATEIQADMNAAIAPDTVPPGAPGNLTANGGLGQVALDWDPAGDNVGVSAYHVHRGSSAGFTPTAGNRIAVVTTGTDFTDNGLAPGDYYYRVRAVDSAANLGPPSNEAHGTATGDTQPPSVALTAPAAGPVSGTIDLRANASDNGSVAGVQFLLDGQALGTEDTATPFERSWDTRTVANGTHQLAARARDAAGNQTTSAAVTVTVANLTGTGLVAAFGFNEGVGFSAADASPEGNTGTVSGAAWAPAGRFGGALSFDGVNDWVTVADDASLDLSGALTMEAWVRPSSPPSGWRTVLLKERSFGHAYALYSGGQGPLVEVASNGYQNAGRTGQLPAATWTHLAATLSGGSLRLYVDGNLVDSITGVGSLPNGDGPLRIGGNSIWGNEFFAGQIDEVRIYNRALSATEIQADMNAAIAPDTVPPGAPGNLTANGGLGQVALDWDPAGDNVGVSAYHVHRGSSAGFTPTAGNRIAVVTTGTDFTDNGLAPGDYYYRVRAVDSAANLGPPSNEAHGTATGDTQPPSVALTAPAAGPVSGTIDLRANASDNGSVAGVQFLLDGQALGTEDTATPFERSWDTRTVANGTHQLAARARDAAGNQTTSAAVTVTVANLTGTGLVAAFGFNEGVGFSAADASPEGNTGTVSGAAWAPAGRFGGALSFDGVNDWVTVADDASLDLSGALTMEAWVRPSSPPSGWRTVLLKERSFGHAYALYSGGQGPLVEVASNGYQNAGRTGQLPAATWTHLAATLSGGSLRLYVDGNLVDSITGVGSLPNGDGPLRIGGNSIWGNEFFAGQIDEVRIYNRALSATEIQADMNAAIAP